MKATVKYSDKATADKEAAKQEHEAEDILTAMMLANGHREQVTARSVLFYSIVPNPNFQPKNMEQRFATVMQGTISVDEQTGEFLDMNIKSVKDLKIVGGSSAASTKASGCTCTIIRAGRHLAQRPERRLRRRPRIVIYPSLLPLQGNHRQLPSLHHNCNSGRPRKAYAVSGPT